jgi:hypothetical protein
MDTSFAFGLRAIHLRAASFRDMECGARGPPHFLAYGGPAADSARRAALLGSERLVDFTQRTCPRAKETSSDHEHLSAVDYALRLGRASRL